MPYKETTHWNTQTFKTKLSMSAIFAYLTLVREYPVTGFITPVVLWALQKLTSKSTGCSATQPFTCIL
jgi:hypothetical protein